MKYLFCLLIPIGITLLIIGIKNTLRFVNAKILYEMPCINREGVFTLAVEGRYSLWLSGRLFTRSPIGKFGLNLINQQTGRYIPLSENLLRTTVSGVKTGRIKLYTFHAEEGTYVISLRGEGSGIDRLGAAFMDVISKQPVDYSRFSIQVREQIPEFVLILCIFGIIFGSMATMSGIILPIVLR